MNKLAAIAPLIRSPNALPTDFFGLGKDMEARARIQLIAMALEGDDRELSIEDFPTSHHFAPSQYGREFTMPAGALVVGKIHKHAHVNVISKGKCIVATFEGEQCYEAPITFVSSAGTQRVVYCLEETVWTTFHSTDSTNVEEIEQEIIAKDYDDCKLPITLTISPVGDKDPL